jgi:hypothetical protein
MRIRHLAVAGLAAIGLLASAAGTATAATQPSAGGGPSTIYAGWSAYPSGGATSAAASWKVPAVTCGAPALSRAWYSSRAGVWVGLWGARNNSNSQLAQVGTVSGCYFGQPTAYIAVKEAYSHTYDYLSSDAAVPLFQVKQGDEIHATVTFVSRETSGSEKGHLKFFYSIGDETAQTGPDQGYLYSSDPAQVKDGTYQGGAIVESLPNGNLGLVLPVGGLASFGEFNFDRDMVNGKGLYLYPGSSRTRFDMYNTIGKDTPGTKPLAITGPATTSTTGVFPPNAGGLKITWKSWN